MGMLGFKWQAGFFLNRQSIDIRPVANRALGLTPLDQDHEGGWQFRWLSDGQVVLLHLFDHV